MSEPKRSDDQRVPADAPLDEGPRQRARTMSRKELAPQFRQQNAHGGLDGADRGGITLEDVGDIMNLTRERVRQLETRGLVKLRVIADDGPRVPLPDDD